MDPLPLVGNSNNLAHDAAGVSDVPPVTVKASGDQVNMIGAGWTHPFVGEWSRHRGLRSLAAVCRRRYRPDS